jgi:predicted nucleic acid-binding protein
LQQQYPKTAEVFLDGLLAEHIPCISAITEIELLRWKTATEKDLEIINRFVQDAIVVDLEKDIKLKAADIRKRQNLKLPDAIIAAPAFVYDLSLITRNTKDFASIAGLSCINPWEM